MRSNAIVFLLLLMILNVVASANTCNKAMPFTNKYPDNINEPTERLRELHWYDNSQFDPKYYPRPITREQQQQYIENILDTTPINQIHPAVFRSAMGPCDFESVNRYLDHGFSFTCYSQEGSSNMLTHFSRCVFKGVDERDRTLEKILQAGINPNEGNKNLASDVAGHYPLSTANEGCDKTMLDLLLKYGADPNLKTKGETYFTIFNVCEGKRERSAIGQPAYVSPAKTEPMDTMMASLLQHGADPNTIYIPQDSRNLATQGRDQVLQSACSETNKRATSVYDFYLHKLQKAQAEGDPVKIDNFQRLLDVLVDYGAQSLTELCKKITDQSKEL